MQLLFAHFFLLIGFQLFAQYSPLEHHLSVYRGELYRFALPFDDTTRLVDIYIPWEAKGKRGLKTLYMHDGQMLFDSTQTWNHKEWKIDESYGSTLSRYAHEPFIVVGIHNDPQNRYAEFFPQKVAQKMPATFREELLQNLWNGELRADAYLNWIENQLVPFIEHNYHVGKKTQDRMVMGSSMGGLISLYALCEKPNLFGGAACLSIHTPMINYGMFSGPMIEALVGPFNAYLAQNLRADHRHYLYIDRGTESLDAYYQPYHDRLLQTLNSVGYNTANTHFLEAIIQGAGHDESAWADRWHIPLLFMLENNGSR